MVIRNVVSPTWSLKSIQSQCIKLLMLLSPSSLSFPPEPSEPPRQVIFYHDKAKSMQPKVTLRPRIHNRIMDGLGKYTMPRCRKVQRKGHTFTVTLQRRMLLIARAK